MSEWFEILDIEHKKYTKECSNALLSQQQNNNSDGWKVGNKSSRSPCPLIRR